MTLDRGLSAPSRRTEERLAGQGADPWADPLVCASAADASFVRRAQAFDNRDRPTRASAAVQGDRPPINAGARLQEKYAALRSQRSVSALMRTHFSFADRLP